MTWPQNNTQKKTVNHLSRPTYLPAAISVSQEAKEDAEDHVAKKHHLEGVGSEKKLSSKQSCDDLLIQCTKRASTSIPGRLELCTGRSEEQVFMTISPGSCGTSSGLHRLMLLLG